MTQRIVTRLPGPLGVALWTLVLVGGCAPADKLAYENFKQIRPHASTKDEVVSLLGEPSHNLGEKWIYERPEKHLQAMIDFDASGKVTRKQWVDAMSTDKLWVDSTDKPAGGKP